VFIDDQKDGQNLLLFAELAGKMVSFGEKGIADRQFLSILWCIHEYGARRH